MEELKIERLIGKEHITITLTEDELEKAYRLKERRYLDEDFANALANAAQNPDTRFSRTPHANTDAACPYRMTQSPPLGTFLTLSKPPHFPCQQIPKL